MKDGTRLIHQIKLADQNSGGISSPLHTSTVFAMSKPTNEGFQYGRVGNPTRQELELNLARYAGAKHCVVFASGSAAITAILMTLRSADGVVCHDEVYEGTQRILTKHFQKFGVTSDFVDCTIPANLEKVFTSKTNVKMVFIESPTNPLLQIINIKEICEITKRHNALVVVDNTFATSLLQQPLALGADVVIESLSKSINGHSDVIGGMVATNDAIMAGEIRMLANNLGTTLSPRDAHQTLRGLKTMQLRVDKQCENAKQIARFLKRQKSVRRVLFPSRQAIAGQMKKSGSIISFNVRGNPSQFLKRLKLITIGHSFGGVETLIQQPTQMMDLSFTGEQLRAFQIDDTFFRLSVGIENVEDIIEDLRNALI